jgi:hypothetical protein
MAEDGGSQASEGLAAGEPGFEPGFTVLETVRIAVNSLPQALQEAKS